MITIIPKIRCEFNPFNVRGDLAKKSGSIAIGSQTPILAFNFTPPKILHNGDSATFTIIPKNVGKLTAKNVDLKVRLNVGSVRPSSISVGDLAVNTPFTQTFTITVPRGYTKSSVELEIDLTQDDFQDLSETRSIAVSVLKPNIAITDHFTDQNGNRKIETGETVSVTIDLKNSGNTAMTAENVAVEISTSVQNVDRMEMSGRTAQIRNTSMTTPLTNFPIFSRI